MKKKVKTRIKRKLRTKGKLLGTIQRPRVCVFRSNQKLFAQFIDDERGVTLIGLSDKILPKDAGKNKITRAEALGVKLAEIAKEKNIGLIVFDRSGYTYHGRVKALADGLRKGGLIF